MTTEVLGSMESGAIFPTNVSDLFQTGLTDKNGRLFFLKLLSEHDAPDQSKLVGQNSGFFNYFDTSVAARYPNEDAIRAYYQVERPDESHIGIVWPENDLIGFIELYKRARRTAEIKYWLDFFKQGEAIMGNAVGQVAEFLVKQSGFSLVVAHVDPDNERSLKVLEQSGFHHSEQYSRFNPNSQLWVYPTKPNDVVIGDES